jgi:hypothetical protein
MHYDIYLDTACRAVPNLNNLHTAIPELEAAEIQAKLTAYPHSRNSWEPQRHPPRPGFLGLNIEEAKARELYSRLSAVEAYGQVLPVAYRDPKITKEQAQSIAEQELVRVCQEIFPAYEHSPVLLREELPRWWIFYTMIRGLPNRGRVLGAGGPMAYIDRVDGHVVKDEELKAVYRGIENP